MRASISLHGNHMADHVQICGIQKLFCKDPAGKLSAACLCCQHHKW